MTGYVAGGQIFYTGVFARSIPLAYNARDRTLRFIIVLKLYCSEAILR